MSTLNFKLTAQEADFIISRMVAGQMDYTTAQSVGNMVAKLQQQANDPELNPKVLNLVEAVKSAQESKNG